MSGFGSGKRQPSGFGADGCWSHLSNEGLGHSRRKPSLSSDTGEIFDYKYENGRRYHGYAAGKYILPNDDKEQERLDIMNHCFRLILDGGLCQTQLRNPKRILDVGTGTGIWAISMGETFPGAEITGVDLSPIQPDMVPPNVRFFVEDISQEWVSPPNYFDFIHVRCLAGSISDWLAFIEECYRHLRPGGKLEISDIRCGIECNDGSYPKDSYTKKWVTEFERISRRNGLNWDVFPACHDIVAQAGFKNVVSEDKLCPIGTWPKEKKLKEIGRYFRCQMLEGAIEGYSLAVFTRFGGWSPAETEVLFAHVRNELKSNKMHIYTYCSFLTAEKPLKSAS